MASSLFQLAQVLFVSRGDLAMVSSLLEEGFALYRELGDKEGIAASLCLAGQVALSQDDLAAARSLGEESVLLYREIGYKWGWASALSFLARVADFQGSAMEARTLYEESLALAREADYKESIASGLEGLAGVVAAQGEPAWAAQLLGTAESVRSTAGIPMPPVERDGYERAVTAAGAQLAEESFAAKWAEGRVMTPEEVIAAHGETIVLPPAATGVAAPSYPAGLTAREVDVLHLVARGLSNAQIARELVLSEKTVAAHLTHIFNKTDSQNRAAAAAFAIRNGLV
jgi:DNA-binding CsgD family transcriptional regulator